MEQQPVTLAGELQVIGILAYLGDQVLLNEVRQKILVSVGAVGSHQRELPVSGLLLDLSQNEIRAAYLGRVLPPLENGKSFQQSPSGVEHLVLLEVDIGQQKAHLRGRIPAPRNRPIEIIIGRIEPVLVFENVPYTVFKIREHGRIAENPGYPKSLPEIISGAVVAVQVKVHVPRTTGGPNLQIQPSQPFENLVGPAILVECQFVLVLHFIDGSHVGRDLAAKKQVIRRRVTFCLEQGKQPLAKMGSRFVMETAHIKGCPCTVQAVVGRMVVCVHMPNQRVGQRLTPNAVRSERQQIVQGPVLGRETVGRPDLRQ